MEIRECTLVAISPLSHVLFTNVLSAMRCIWTFLAFLTLSLSYSYAQQRTSGYIENPSGQGGKYAMYMPSCGKAGLQGVLLAFHPLGAYQWNADSWRNLLAEVAEQQKMLLICPDGGTDARSDDPEDLAFARFLLDSMMTRFRVHHLKVTAIGFSWGARAALRMTLTYPNRFQGLLLISPSVESAYEYESDIPRIRDLRCYIIHGKKDAPELRFYPLRKIMMDQGICFEGKILPETGHTIDFPGRNAMMGEALTWIRNTQCAPIIPYAAMRTRSVEELVIYPNPTQGGLQIWITTRSGTAMIRQIHVYDESGILVKSVNRGGATVTVAFPYKGNFLLNIEADGFTASRRVVVN